MILLIRNNFSILLAERQLKITRVSIDTGISRSTLTSISQNDTKMIQTEIIDKLCFYLNIEPKDFFVYIPMAYNIEIVNNRDNIEGNVQQLGYDEKEENDNLPDIMEVNIKNPQYDVFLKFIDKSQVAPVEYTEELSLYFDSFKLDELPFSTDKVESKLSFSSKNDQNRFLQNIWSKLDPTMKKLYIEQLTDEIKAALKNDLFKLIENRGYLAKNDQNSFKRSIEGRLKSMDIIYHNPIFDLD